MSKKKSSAGAGHATASVQAALQQALAWHQQGQWAAAEKLYGHVLSIDPQHVDALHYMGILASQTGRPEEGVRLIREAIRISPRHHALHSNLGNALLAMSRHAEAVQAYAGSLALKPDFAPAYFNMGVCHFALHSYAEAAESFQQALAVAPQMVAAHQQLAMAWAALGQHGRAVEHFNQFLSHQPDDIEALLALAGSLEALDRKDEALAAFNRVITLNPDNPEAFFRAGHVLRSSFGMLEESVQYLQEAIRLKPDYAQAWNQLGGTQLELGQMSDALASYRKSIEIDPSFLDGHTNVLFMLSYSTSHSTAQYLEQAKVYHDVLQQMATPFTQWHCPPCGDGQPLRIGLVSGDLRHHPVGFFLEGLVKHLDKRKVALYAYTTQTKEDAVTARLKPHFAQWQMMPDSTEQAAHVIHKDGVHILVDLAGHTGLNKLEVFAWRPAPVQVSWLGYFASTGAPHMDWILADPVSVPQGAESQFTERVMRLPHTRLCFTPYPSAPEVSRLPAPSAGHVTLGSFQPMSKLNPKVLSLWSRVLAAIPTARLRLQNRVLADPKYRSRLIEALGAAGISEARVDFQGPVRYEAYLQSYEAVDFLLDTFPFTGGTTTCEALWMGVPTLTLAGATMLSRQGEAIMTASQLSDWIARDEDDFVRLAVHKASDLDALAHLRQRLRSSLPATPMFNSPLFASDWLTAMEKIWADHEARPIGL